MVWSRRWMVLALMGVLALAGCGVSGGDENGSDPGSGSSVGAGQMDIATAGAKYEEIVARPNCAGAAFIDAAASLEATTSIKDAEAALQPLAADAADAYETFGSAMDAESWPDEARSAAKTVATRAHQEADTYRAVAEAKDTESFRAALTALQQEEQAPRVSGPLRAVLGLDANRSSQGLDC